MVLTAVNLSFSSVRVHHLEYGEGNILQPVGFTVAERCSEPNVTTMPRAKIIFSSATKSFFSVSFTDIEFSVVTVV